MKRELLLCISILFCALIQSQNNDRYVIKNINVNNKNTNTGVSFFNEDFVIYSTVKEFNPKSKKEERLGKKLGLDTKNDLDFYFGYADESGNITNSQKLSKKINSNMHELNLVFTKDLKRVYFTRNSKIAGQVHLELYTATVMTPSSWTNIRKLPFNSGNYSFGDPCLSDDDKTLYFTSNMGGTLGDFDIFKVAILGENKYGIPTNLGPQINTNKKETTPFIENNTLYFSSNGRGGNGGLDIFSVSLNNLDQVTNLGSPINSNKDDFSFVIKDRNYGFFASNKLNGKGAEDIYYFKLFDENSSDEIASFLDYEEFSTTKIKKKKENINTEIRNVNNEEITDEIQNLKNEILALNTLKNNSSNNDDVKIYKEEIDKMKNEISELNTIVNGLKQNDQMQSELEKMKQEIVVLKKESKKDQLIQAELDKMKEEITNLKINNSVLNNQLQKYEKEYEKDLISSTNKSNNNYDKVNVFDVFDVSDVSDVSNEPNINISNNYTSEVTNQSSNDLIDAVNRFDNPTANKSAFIYKDNRLNIATNLNDLDNVPVYPGCEEIEDENARKNCLITKVSTFSNENFNTKVISRPKRGFNYIRVIFLVDKNGNSEAVKISGDWDKSIQNEVKRVIASLPKMKPGLLNNQPKNIKYSFRLPFIVK